MSRKSILFVIDSLHIGGAEKSLVSLLNNIDQKKYDIYLLMFKKGGDLENLLPSNINILDTPDYFISKGERVLSKFINIFYRIKVSINIRLNSIRKHPLHSEQVVYNTIKKVLGSVEYTFDVAIAYSQGMPTYFVSDKITSRKKLAWINTDYRNTLYDKDIDFKSYSRFDEIITVSENTKKSVTSIRDEYKNKVDIIRDILNPELIMKMGDEKIVERFNEKKINILTVGRLVAVKGYDKAIRVADLLKKAGFNFVWVVIGEGPERSSLQALIDEKNLSEEFILIGKKMNPYAYMKKCDIYVQTSLKEGFGLTITEAKILKKPIVCTDFPTASEIINNEVDGVIVENNVNRIYEGIKRFILDENFKRNIINNLETSKQYDSRDQIEKFYSKLG